MENNYVKGTLDNDLYKFTMQNVACKLYPNAQVRSNFINRDGREFPEGFGKEVTRIIDTFRGFALTKEGYNFLREKCYYLNPVYLDFLKGYKFDPKEVKIEQQDAVLNCTVNGHWYRNILWEVPLMAVISQLYFEMTGETKLNRKERKEINHKKFTALKELGIYVADLGTRRRYSFQNHDEVIQDLVQYVINVLGTSNVYLAMKHDLTPIGTMAHEFIQYHAARYGFRMANEMAMKAWSGVYQGNLGTALPDTFTTGVFYRSFNTYYAKLFDGLRNDSGDPITFTENTIEKYKSLRIDPITKKITFSNNINSIDKISEIHNACLNRIRDIYGSGTWLTNDVGVKPLNMVIKMMACFIDGQWIDTIKLSDDESKNTGKKGMIEHCKRELIL